MPDYDDKSFGKKAFCILNRTGITVDQSNPFAIPQDQINYISLYSYSSSTNPVSGNRSTYRFHNIKNNFVSTLSGNLTGAYNLLTGNYAVTPQIPGNYRFYGEIIMQEPERGTFSFEYSFNGNAVTTYTREQCQSIRYTGVSSSLALGTSSQSFSGRKIVFNETGFFNGSSDYAQIFILHSGIPFTGGIPALVSYASAVCIASVSGDIYRYEGFDKIYIEQI